MRSFLQLSSCWIARLDESDHCDLAEMPVLLQDEQNASSLLSSILPRQCLEATIVKKKWSVHPLRLAGPLQCLPVQAARIPKLGRLQNPAASRPRTS